jgi:two-component system response regulator ResD
VGPELPTPGVDPTSSRNNHGVHGQSGDNVETNQSGQPSPPARRQRILVIDDDPTVAEIITGYLQRAGFTTVVASDGETGLELAQQLAPALVVLDRVLPGIDGIEVCRRLRTTSQVPLIMLTSLGDEEDRLRGLGVGADDYQIKPFSPRELVMRVQSLLRRTGAPALARADGPLRSGDLAVDQASRVVTKSGRVLSLTNKEFELLVFLLNHPGQVFRRDELMRRVWVQDFGETSTITVHVRRLREKIEDDPANPRAIVTVWGVGYRFDPPGA